MNAGETTKRSAKPQVEVGQRFGRLVTVEWSKADGRRCRLWQCKCDCGRQVAIRSDRLTSGKTRSCGCLRFDANHDPNRKRFTIHGLSRHELYKMWSRMKERCLNKRDTNYPRYGGRGIKVCERWRKSFKAFLSDMGERPSPSHQIDRIDNDGDYRPGNCRWVNRKTQSRNRRSNNLVEIEGVKKCLTDWAKEYGVNPKTVFKRIRSGMSPIEALKNGRG